MSSLQVCSSPESQDSWDCYEPFKKLARVQIHPAPNPNKPPTSFSITDILSARWGGSGGGAGENGTRRNRLCGTDRRSPNGHSIVRPWASSPDPRAESPGSSEGQDDGDDDLEDIEVDVTEDKPPVSVKVSPLDALFKMTSNTFDGSDPSSPGADDPSRRDQLSLFTKSQPPKKRRKSRTAFTNQQIYELEKRFLYQKYLTPADRDEIAATLGLSTAQVITWFQNRRAKLKRDLEELKADVTAAKSDKICADVTTAVFNVADEVALFQRHGLKKIAEKKAAALSSSPTS